MDAIRQYNQQRLLVRLMETAKEFTILVAMLKLMTFISVEEVPRIRLVQVAASIRKTYMVNVQNLISNVVTKSYLFCIMYSILYSFKVFF